MTRGCGSGRDRRRCVPGVGAALPDVGFPALPAACRALLAPDHAERALAVYDDCPVAASSSAAMPRPASGRPCRVRRTWRRCPWPSMRSERPGSCGATTSACTRTVRPANGSAPGWRSTPCSPPTTSTSWAGCPTRRRPWLACSPGSRRCRCAPPLRATAPERLAPIVGRGPPPVTTAPPDRGPRRRGRPRAPGDSSGAGRPPSGCTSGADRSAAWRCAGSATRSSSGPDRGGRRDGGAGRLRPRRPDQRQGCAAGRASSRSGRARQSASALPLYARDTPLTSPPPRRRERRLVAPTAGGSPRPSALHPHQDLPLA